MSPMVENKIAIKASGYVFKKKKKSVRIEPSD